MVKPSKNLYMKKLMIQWSAMNLLWYRQLINMTGIHFPTIRMLC